ncbi:hypothetical protein SDJN02_24183, partial [Cucurbita argyrosperma subsp. argyrosperma]
MDEKVEKNQNSLLDYILLNHATMVGIACSQNGWLLRILKGGYCEQKSSEVCFLGDQLLQAKALTEKGRRAISSELERLKMYPFLYHVQSCTPKIVTVQTAENSKPKALNMAIKPTVALRAVLVGGIAAFAKIAGAMKAAGGVKLGAATAAMTAAATAALAGSKQDQKDDSKHPPK